MSKVAATYLSKIKIPVEELYNLVLEMKEAGEKVVELQICEPVPDIEMRKHVTFEAYGTSPGGATDYEQIEAVTDEEFEHALWNDPDEEDTPEGYEATQELLIIFE